MGILDKAKFWKKEEIDFDKLVEQESPTPSADHLGLEEDHLGLNEKSPFPEEQTSSSPLTLSSMAAQKQMASQQPQANNWSSRELELINSKLDTIKALLTSLDQRLANVEKSSGVAAQKTPRLW